MIRQSCTNLKMTVQRNVTFRWMNHRITTTLRNTTRNNTTSTSSSTSTSLLSTVQKVQSRLQQSETHSQSQTQNWDDLWKDGLTPWDLGKPTPLLIQEIHQNNIPKTARTVLIPGCGAAYDVTSFLHHFMQCTIVGLDISPTSLHRAKQVITQEVVDKNHKNTVHLMLGDFFTNSWNPFDSMTNHDKNHHPHPLPSQFDFIMDYTFFCALPPTFRDAWGRRMGELLEKRGQLLTIMFPILPLADTSRGPPYPVSIHDYQQALIPHGIIMDGEPFTSTASVPSRAGKEMVCYWKKEGDTPF